jgi:adenylate cyclase
MVLGAYRKEQVSQEINAHRPLDPLINEIQSQLRGTQIDLSEADGLSFTNALLDSEPNLLNNSFRQTLNQHTGGNPLFTVELLRGLKERGDLIKDQSGKWQASVEIDWDILPPNVEEVIAECIHRLSPEFQNLLASASVQGESFIAEVLALAIGKRKAEIIKCLSRSLAKQHQIVRAQSSKVIGDNEISIYQFRHSLFQKYLYQSLDIIERAQLHKTTGKSLEALYRSQSGNTSAVETSSARLAWHFEQAGMFDHAVAYLQKAGQESYMLSVNKEATSHFKKGLKLISQMPETPERPLQQIDLLLDYSAPLRSIRGFASAEAGVISAQACQLAQEIGDNCRLISAKLLLWSHYITLGKYYRALELGNQIQKIAHEEQNQTAIALGNFAIGVTMLLMGEFDKGMNLLEHGKPPPEFHEQAQFISPLLLDIRVARLIFGSWALWFTGSPDQSLLMSQEAISLAQELNHPFSLVFAQGMAGCVIHTLRREFRLAQLSAEKLIQIAREKDFGYFQHWPLVFVGRSQIYHGRVSEGFHNLHAGLNGYQSMGQKMMTTFLMGTLLDANGNKKEGHVILANAMRLVQETGERIFEAELRRLQGERFLSNAVNLKGADSIGSIRKAEACFKNAHRIARQQGAKSLELRASTSLSRLWIQQGKKKEALELLENIYMWFSEGHETLDLQDAKLLLEDLRVMQPS